MLRHLTVLRIGKQVCLMRIKQSRIFARNYKKLAKKNYRMEKLDRVVLHLLNQETVVLKQKYKDHALKGNLKGLRELHIENNWLLVYRIENEHLELWLLATGSHDDIFRYQYKD